MNETLLYIILGVLYLVFTVLGRAAKKRQAQAQREEDWSLEEAMADLQGSSEDQPNITSTPTIFEVLQLDPPQAEPVDQTNFASTPVLPEPSKSSGEYPSYRSTGDEFPSVRNQLTPESAELSESHFPVPPEPTKAPEGAHVNAPTEANPIAEMLKDQNSARNAIILSEILRKPKGARGFPRSYLKR